MIDERRGGRRGMLFVDRWHALETTVDVAVGVKIVEFCKKKKVHNCQKDNWVTVMTIM